MPRKQLQESKPPKTRRKKKRRGSCLTGSVIMWGPNLARGSGSGPTCYTCDLCAYCSLLLYFSIYREIKVGGGMAHIWFPTFVGPTGRDKGGTHFSFIPVSLFELPCPLLEPVFFFFLCLYGQLGRG